MLKSGMMNASVHQPERPCVRGTTKISQMSIDIRVPTPYHRGMRTRCSVAAVVLTAAALLATQSARGSDWVVNAPQKPALSADAKDDVGVSWVQGGARVSLVVPPSGKVYHAALPGPDASRPASVPGLAFTPIVRRAPGGWLVAAQIWQAAGQPAALHVARWKGAPTQLTLADDGTHLTGTATFQGKPVTGTSPTPSGTRMRIYVYLDCFGCPAAPQGWSAMLGVAPKSDGSFSVLLKPAWTGSRYRAEVEGPNVGETLAPDAQAFVTAP